MPLVSRVVVTLFSTSLLLTSCQKLGSEVRAASDAAKAPLSSESIVIVIERPELKARFLKVSFSSADPLRLINFAAMPSFAASSKMSEF
jgi:hypothetical protein